MTNVVPNLDEPDAAEASFRGGARIGRVNASWPFARLTARRDVLRIASLGSYAFTPSEVVSLDACPSRLFLSSGILIRHNRPDCPATVIFWCMGKPARVLAAIRDVGFVPSGQPGPRVAGFPVR